MSFQTALWRAKIEHKFDMSPFAIFAAYQGTQTTFEDERVFDHRLLAGLRIYLGDKTLRANGTSGATLDIIEPMSLWTPSLN